MHNTLYPKLLLSLNRLLQMQKLTNLHQYDKKVQKLGEPHLRLKNGSVAQIKKNGIASHQVSTPSTGQGAKHATHKHTGSSIILYTPPTTKYEYKASYEQAETKNLALL